MEKNEIEEILKKQGDARGAVFHTDLNYVLQKTASEDSVAKIEEKLKEWGVNLVYRKVEPMSWYPVAWRTLSLLAIQEVLGWDDEEIIKMGRNAPRVSVIVKLFFKLFPDIGKFARQIPKYWTKHYTCGTLKVVELDKDNKQLILRLENFAFHPILCKYLKGYFETATKLTRPKDSIVTCEEIQCTFKDSTPYEVYQIKWTK
ncbi:MAG: hypothetical protein AAB620_00570 [Patescibacteria group bacterium]